MPVLTKQQQKFYEENGYILIDKMIPHDFIEELKKRFIDICNKQVDHEVLIVMEDLSLKKKGAKGENLINKLQDFPYDEILSKYITHTDVLNIVEELIGPNISTIHSMLINKPPSGDADYSVHPLHQDLYYFPFRPADKILASWTAMEKIDENNGCLYVVPGSHRKTQLYNHEYPQGKNVKLYYGIQNFEHLPKINLVMQEGDTVFFHPLLLHGSGPNKTTRFRKAISSHYASNDCYYIDVKGTTQENISKEIEDLLKKRKINMSFQEVWLNKNRIVRGKPGQLQELRSHI